MIFVTAAEQQNTDLDNSGGSFPRARFPRWHSDSAPDLWLAQMDKGG